MILDNNKKNAARIKTIMKKVTYRIDLKVWIPKRRVKSEKLSEIATFTRNLQSDVIYPMMT